MTKTLAFALLAAVAGCHSNYHSAVATSADYGPPAPTATGDSIAQERGPARNEVPQPESVERPGLGTSYGEQVNAPISFTPFTRAGSNPFAEMAMHYNDAQGVTEHARYLGASLTPIELYTEDNALSVSLVDESGRMLPGFTAQGRTLVMGEDGGRYKIEVKNSTSARFEVVASVDGLDVIDGKPADPNRRGYIVNAHDTLVIDGFRTSDDAVAAFRFGAVKDSYAAQTSGERNVGVVGVAIFAERGAVWTRGELGLRDTANPFPERGYAAPPRN
jgi:hypothetical protein